MRAPDRRLRFPDSRRGLSNLGFLTNGHVSRMGGVTRLNARLTRMSNKIPGLHMDIPSLGRCCLKRLVCFFRGTYKVDKCLLRMGPFGRPNMRTCGGGVFTLLGGPKCRGRSRTVQTHLGGWVGRDLSLHFWLANAGCVGDALSFCGRDTFVWYIPRCCGPCRRIPAEGRPVSCRPSLCARQLGNHVIQCKQDVIQLRRRPYRHLTWNGRTVQGRPRREKDLPPQEACQYNGRRRHRPGEGEL